MQQKMNITTDEKGHRTATIVFAKGGVESLKERPDVFSRNLLLIDLSNI